MKLYTIKKDYINFLKRYEPRVPNIDYGDRLKPFIGTVFQSTIGCDYFCPISSAKPKFEKMKDNIDFIRIIDSNEKVLCAVNINDMFPVPKDEVIEITQESLDNLRSFDSSKAKQSYWKLLKRELMIINIIEERILINAEKVYWIHKNSPNHPLNKRCLNFTLLNEKCKEYELTKAHNRFPNEEQNKHIADKYLSVTEGKVTCEFDHKIYLTERNPIDLSLQKFSKDDSFFYGQFETYAQILYRNIDDMKKTMQENIIKLSDSEQAYLFENSLSLQKDDQQKSELSEDDLEYQH